MPLYEVEDPDGVYEFDSAVELNDDQLLGLYDSEIVRPRNRENVIAQGANLLMQQDEAAWSAAAREAGPVGATGLGMSKSLSKAANTSIDSRQTLEETIKTQDESAVANIVPAILGSALMLPNTEKKLSAIEQSDLDYQHKINQAVIGLPPEDREQALIGIKELADVQRGAKDVAVVNDTLRLNPALVWDEDRAKAAILTSEASEEQQQKLISELPALKKQAAEQELPIFQKLSEFQEWVKEYPELKTPEEQIQGYKDGHSGWWNELPAQLKLGLSQGRAQLAQQMQGLLGAALKLEGKIPGLSMADEFGNQMLDAAAVSGEESQKLGELSQAVGGAPIVADFSAGATSIVAPLVAGWGVGRVASSLTGPALSEAAVASIRSNAGFGGSIGASALQSFGATFPEAVEAKEKALIEQGVDPIIAREQAVDEAYVPSFLSGLTTGVVTAIGGKTGVEGAFRITQLKPTIKGFLKEGFRDVTNEALEEGSDELIQGMIALHSYDPNRPIDQIVEGAFKAAAIGGVLGGGVHTFKSALEGVTKQWEKENAEPAAVQAEAAGAPATAAAIRAKAEAESEAKFKEFEESFATSELAKTASEGKTPWWAQSTPKSAIAEIPGFDPNKPEFTSEDSPEVKEAKIQQVLATKEGKTPGEQAAFVASVRNPTELTITPVEQMPVVVSPELQALAPETAQAITTVSETAPTTETSPEATLPSTTEETPQLESSELPSTTPTLAAEAVSPSEPAIEDQATLPQPQPTLEALPVETEIPQEATIEQQAQPETPSLEILSQANEATTTVTTEPVSESPEPTVATEPVPEAQPEPQVSEASLARREAQQRRLNQKRAETGSFSKYDSRVEKEEQKAAKSGVSLPEPDSKAVDDFISYVDNNTARLQEQFTPEITDDIKSTAIRYYAHLLRTGKKAAPSIILSDVQKDYAEKLKTRPELQRQASLDAPLSDEGTATVADTIRSQDRDVHQESLTTATDSLSDSERSTWTKAFTTVAQSMQDGTSYEEAVASLDPESKELFDRVRNSAVKIRDDSLGAGARPKRRVDKVIAGRVDNNLYVTERVPTEVSERNKGTDLSSAEAVARSSHEAIPGHAKRGEFGNVQPKPKRTKAQFDFQEESRPVEQQALEKWAKDKGKLLKDEDFEKEWKAQEEPGGSEHDVYFDEDKQLWYKRGNLNMNQEDGLLGYLQRMMLHNFFFPEAPITLEGFARTPSQLKGKEFIPSRLSPIVSQVHAKGRNASIPEIDAFMQRRGFAYDQAQGAYVKGDIHATDLHGQNVIVLTDSEGNDLTDSEGNPRIAVIDPVIYQTLESKTNRVGEMALNGETLSETDEFLRAGAAVAQKIQESQTPLSEHPLIAQLESELRRVAPGVRIVSSVDPFGGTMWTDGENVYVDPERLQAKLDEHPDSPGLRDRMLNEEVKHIAGLKALTDEAKQELSRDDYESDQDYSEAVRQLAREKAETIGAAISPDVADQLAREYVPRTAEDTDESYEQAVQEFKDDHYRLAHEYLRSIAQRFQNGFSTEDLQIPNDPGIIGTIRKYLQAIVRFLKARLKVAFDPELADHIYRIQNAERALGMREGAIKDLDLNQDESSALSSNGEQFGITPSQIKSITDLPPSVPADFEKVGNVWVHKGVQKLAAKDPLYQKLIDEAQKYPGLKLGMGQSLASYWAGDPYQVRVGDDLGTVFSEKDIPTILRHEAIHALTYNLVGEAKVGSIAQSLTTERREAIARAYLSASPVERSAEQLEADIQKISKSDFQVGYEYLRQLTEQIMTGDISESMLADLKDQSLVGKLRDYLKAFLASLRQFIQQNPDDDAVKEARRISNFLRNTQQTSGDMLFAAGRRLNSTALHRVLAAPLDEDMKRLIADRTYVSDSWNNLRKQAGEWIAKQGDTEDVVDLDVIVNKIDLSYLSDSVKAYAREQIAQKYQRLMDAMKDGPLTIDRAILYDHIKRQQARLIQQLGDFASNAGQVLADVKGISESFVPETYRSAYTGKLTKQQAASIEGTAGAKEVEEAIKTSRKAGAKAATTRALKSLKKMLGKDDPAQELFDFFVKMTDPEADLLKLLEPELEKFRGDMIGRSSGMPALEELKQAVSKKVSKILLAQQGVKPTDGIFKDLDQKVTAAVKNQLKAPEYGPNEAPPSDDQKRADLLSALVDQIANLDLVERAFNQSVQDTLAATPRPMEARIARLQGLKFDRAKYLNAMKLVQLSVDFQETVTKTLEQQDSELFNLLTSVAATTGLEGDQARLLAEAIQSAYDLEARNVARKELEKIHTSYLNKEANKGKIKLTEPQIQKLLKMVNLGAFRQERFYNALAESFGLPSYNEAFADEIEKRGKEIQRMPESDARNEATRRLLTDIAKERVKGYKRGEKARHYLMDVAPAVWKAGILSGVPTHLVNLFSAQANVLASASADAAGYVQAARKAGIKGANTRDFMADVITGWLKNTGIMQNPANEATRQEIQKALKTGTTRFWNERGEEMSILENFPAYIPYKYIGRLMIATDTISQVQSNEIKQRMALRYMWLQSGKSREEINALMNDAFNPAQSVLEQIDSQVEAESEFLKTKLDRDRRRTELIEKRRFEIMEGLDQQSRQTANDWTFNSDNPHGLVGYIAREVIKPFNRKTKIGEFIIPFVNTLTNIVNNTFDWSPIGILRGYNVSATKLLGLEKYQRDFKPDSPEQLSQLTKAWVGTIALMGIAAAMAAGWKDEDEGKEPFLAVFGEGPDDPVKRRQLEEGSSWQANTIKIGPARIRYTDFPILSLFLGSLGKASDLHRYGNYDDKEWGEIAVKSALSIGSSLLEKNLLSGASNIIDIMSDPEGKGIGGLKRFTSGIVGGYTNPQLFKWARDTMGMTRDGGMVPSLDKSTLEGWLYSMVPFSIGYDTTYLNVLGEEITNYPWAATSRRFGVMDPTPQHPILSPLVQNGLFISSPSKSTTIGKGDNQVRVGSDPELWRDFVRARGDAIKKKLTPDRIEKILAMPKDDAQEYLDNVIASDARDVAKRKLTKERNASTSP